jgi:hypothetical protein
MGARPLLHTVYAVAGDHHGRCGTGHNRVCRQTRALLACGMQLCVVFPFYATDLCASVVRRRAKCNASASTAHACSHRRCISSCTTTAQRGATATFSRQWCVRATETCAHTCVQMLTRGGTGNNNVVMYVHNTYSTASTNCI